MEMVMNVDSFLALEQQDLFAVDGGDRARQEMMAAYRASGESLGSAKTAVNAQATVTGWAISLIGVAAAIPTGGASLVLSGIGAGIATMGLVSL